MMEPMTIVVLAAACYLLFCLTIIAALYIHARANKKRGGLLDDAVFRRFIDK